MGKVGLLRRKVSGTCDKVGPQRYLPDLAKRLGALGTVLISLGELRKEEEAFSESMKLVQPFAQQLPNSPFETLFKDLTSSLEGARKVER